MCSNTRRPSGVPGDYIETMHDLVQLNFQSWNLL